MKRDFSTKVIGWLFILSALMLWLGWIFLPVHIGIFFEPGDFSAIFSQWYFWIWMFRIHLFGYLITVMSFVAFGAYLSQIESRIVIWPGIAVASAGLIVSALAAAYYYHFGAWGALAMEGKSTAEVLSFIDSLEVSTEYITCLVRFGHVFFGLGLLVVALGILKWKILPTWIAAIAILLGVVGMAVTMAFPDNLEYYSPIFHLNSLWLVVTGVIVLRNGMFLES